MWYRGAGGTGADEPRPAEPQAGEPFAIPPPPPCPGGPLNRPFEAGFFRALFYRTSSFPRTVFRI